MKYTKEERLFIGQRIYEGKISRFEAAEEYGISPDTARQYMRMYRDALHSPDRPAQNTAASAPEPALSPLSIEKYEAMSREELIHELIAAKISEARLKKGYEVKGAGAQKKYIRLEKQNTGSS